MVVAAFFLLKDECVCVLDVGRDLFVERLDSASVPSCVISSGRSASLCLHCKYTTQLRVYSCSIYRAKQLSYWVCL